MTDPNMKHPNYENELLPVNNDIFKPEFKRDSRGRYFMQLPGYGKWMVGNEPGSKIISQGSEDEHGNAATNPGSLMTGSLSVETVISVGDTIFINGGTGCIFVGDPAKHETRPYISLCQNGLLGHSPGETTFAFFLEDTTSVWNSTTGETLDRGDVFIGGLGSDEFVLWNESEGKLYIKGDLVIEGDIVSANYVYNTAGYKLEYLTGNAYFNDVFIHGGTIDQSLITNLLPGSEPSIQGWSHDMEFTATDWDTMTWTGPGGAATGDIYLTDGTTYSVNSGTMDMTTDDPYYIYYNGTSTLQTTSDPTQAVGSGKILITVARRNFTDNTKKATFQVFGNEGQGVFIVADDIAANTITANEIFANTITTNQIDFNTITGDNIDTLNISGKNATFDRGSIAGWVMSDYCLTKDQDIGASGETRMQICTGYESSPGVYVEGHIQAAYNHNRITYPGFPHPNAPIDLIQITQGNPTDPSGQPEPRMDIYRATATNQSKKRMKLDAFGLTFFDENEVSVGTITGNDTGTYTDFNISDMRIANDTVRIWNRGIRTKHDAGTGSIGLNLADQTGANYLRMFVDISSRDYAGTIDLPTSDILTVRDKGGPPGNKIVSFVGRYAYSNYGVTDFFQPIALLARNGSTQAIPSGASNGWMFYHSGYNEVWAFVAGSWEAMQTGASALPSGNQYDSLVCDGGTSWSTTSVLYPGARFDYRIYRDWTGDLYFDIPSGRDYAFKRGASFDCVIDDNIWTKGELWLGSGNVIIKWDGSKCDINTDTHVHGSITCTGSVEMNVGRVRVGGTDFYPTTAAFDPTKSYLRS